MAGHRLFAALLLFLAAPAAAQDRPDPECGDDRGVDRCAPAQQAAVRTLFGVQPIEAHRDAGDQVRRAFYVDGYGRDVVAIAFVRAPGRDPEVRVYFKRAAGMSDLSPLVAPVPPESWDHLIERSSHFDRRLVPLPPPPADSGEIVVCLHSWVYTVEAADPARSETEPATVRRRTEDACADGLTKVFAQELYRAALPLLPHCALLDPRHYRTPANQLAACGALGGDRQAAARVRNRAEALFRIDGTNDLATIAPLFDYRSSIDWNGARSARGDVDSAARFFLARAVEAGRNSFYLDSIEGLSAGRVRLRGGFVRFVPVPGQGEATAEAARAEMIWEAEYEDHFQIRSVTVGPYERLPQR